MAGKHSDHYFRRWQAKIVTTIKKKWKKMEKKPKVLVSMGGRVDRQERADGERGPPSALAEIVLSNSLPRPNLGVDFTFVW